VRLRTYLLELRILGWAAIKNHFALRCECCELQAGVLLDHVVRLAQCDWVTAAQGEVQSLHHGNFWPFGS
jgi:hypothetical protein